MFVADFLIFGCFQQTLNLSQWVNFPKDYRYFPILLRTPKLKLSPPMVYVLVEAHLDKYVPHQSDVIQVEAFGEPVAWKASENLEIILKTDMDNLTKLIHCFSKSDIDINHELRLLKVESKYSVGENCFREDRSL